MEIVIKLSERAYEFVKQNGLKDVFGIDTAICNGVVLPKGHGALKDADSIIYAHAMTKFDWRDCIDIEDLKKAQTIIEADTEEDDE